MLKTEKRPKKLRKEEKKRKSYRVFTSRINIESAEKEQPTLGKGLRSIK